MSTIINAICALIPDGVEQWIAHGGNVVVILAALAVLAVRELVRRPAAAPRGDAAPVQGWTPNDEARP